MKSKNRYNKKKKKAKHRRRRFVRISERIPLHGGRSDATILKELLLLKANILTLFVMAKELVLKYYPDADVPNKNLLIKGLIKMAENVQELVCQIANMIHSMICVNPSSESSPAGVKDLVCKNSNKATELTCDTMKDVLALLNRLSQTHISDMLVDAVKGKSEIYLPV